MVWPILNIELYHYTLPTETVPQKGGDPELAQAGIQPSNDEDDEEEDEEEEAGFCEKFCSSCCPKCRKCLWLVCLRVGEPPLFCRCGMHTVPTHRFSLPL